MIEFQTVILLKNILQNQKQAIRQIKVYFVFLQTINFQPLKIIAH
jgi:hypothetical protein